MKRRRPVAFIAALAAAGAIVMAGTGCARERRLFDVVIEVTEAVALEGALDDGALSLSHQIVPDVGTPNGNDQLATAVRLELDPAATSLHVTLDALDGDLTLVGFGRSATFSVPAEGETLTAPLLLAPANAVGALTSLPPATGGDSCLADDGVGTVFIVGGSTSQQGAYAFDGAFDIVTITGADFPVGVGGPGCAARGGVVAVAGGCGGTVDDGAVHVLQQDGTRTTLPTDRIEVTCGAAAAPRSDGAVWLLDGDNSLHRVDGNGSTDVGAIGAGPHTGLEVTDDDALVVLVGGEAFYARDTVSNLGAVVALGRRGKDVLVLDDAGAVASVENAATRAVFDGVTFNDVRSFVVTDDDTFVSLRGDGRTIDVRFADGETRSVPTGGAATRLAALPGGTIVVGGADVDGLQAVALKR